MTTARKPAARKAAAAPPAAPETGADILNRIKPKRRIEHADICLRADLIAEFQQDDGVLNDLKANVAVSNRLHPGAEAVAESDEYVAQAKKVRKLEEAIKAALVRFTFESMNKDEWRSMLDNNPPRKDSPTDYLIGYNRDAVLDQMVRRSLLSPVFEDCNGCADPECRDRPCREHGVCAHDDCGTWQQLVKVINPAEWGELRDAANRANSAVVEAPFSVLASLTLDKRASGSR